MGEAVESQRNRRDRPEGADLASHREPPEGPVSAPGVAELTALRTTLESRQEQAIAQVGSLVNGQQSLTTSIATDLSTLREVGDTLQELERAESEPVGLFGSLTRRLGRRGRLMQRRTVAAQLQAQYESLHTTLRKAGAFSDELRLCAAELAGEVDHLHGDVEASLASSARAEARMVEIDEALAELDLTADPSQARAADRLRFERADLKTAVTLFEAKARLCAQEVEPVRKLRETVQTLHEEMAHYVLNATTSIEGSGRRIQALGLAADAPLVVTELQAGLDQLDGAMVATEAYLEQAHDLLTRVLPELSEQVRLQNARADLDLQKGLEAMGEARSDGATDAELRAAAVAEVELLGLTMSGGGD